MAIVAVYMRQGMYIVSNNLMKAILLARKTHNERFSY